MTSDVYRELREAPEPFPPPSRVLAIGAHPDDIEFGAGATLARWASTGSHVVMAVVTDGSKGTWDGAADPDGLASRRREEQEAAAALLGAAQVVHLGYVDGELEYSMELRSRMARLIREQKPDLVLSHDPWQRYQMHPDHRATGLGVVDGIVAARDPLFFREHGLPPHRPGTLLLWSADAPDHCEPASEEALLAKIEALLCHRSQAETTMAGADRGEGEREAFAEKIRSWARRAGSGFGVSSAEVFKRLTP